jgi:hypothetical protein
VPPAAAAVAACHICWQRCCAIWLCALQARSLNRIYGQHHHLFEKEAAASGGRREWLLLLRWWRQLLHALYRVASFDACSPMLILLPAPASLTFSHIALLALSAAYRADLALAAKTIRDFDDAITRVAFGWPDGEPPGAIERRLPLPAITPGSRLQSSAVSS